MATKDYATEKAAMRAAKNAGLMDHMIQIDELHNGRFIFSIKSDLTADSDEVPARELDEDTAAEAEAQRAADAAAFDAADATPGTALAIVANTATMAGALEAAERLADGETVIFPDAGAADPFRVMVSAEALGAVAVDVDDEAENGPTFEGEDDDEDEDTAGKSRAELLGVDPALWDHATQAQRDRDEEAKLNATSDDEDQAEGDDEAEAEGEAEAPPAAAWMTKGRTYILAIEGDSFDHTSPAFAALEIAKRMKRPVIIRDASTFEKLTVIHPDAKVRGVTSPRQPREPGAPRASRGETDVVKKTIELARRPEGTNRKELETVVEAKKNAWTTMIKAAADRHGWVYHAVTGSDRRTTYWLLDQDAPLPEASGSAWSAVSAEAAASIAGM